MQARSKTMTFQYMQTETGESVWVLTLTELLHLERTEVLLQTLCDSRGLTMHLFKAQRQAVLTWKTNTIQGVRSINRHIPLIPHVLYTHDPVDKCNSYNIFSQ